jgi:hypothetical protein
VHVKSVCERVAHVCKKSDHSTALALVCSAASIPFAPFSLSPPSPSGDCLHRAVYLLQPATRSAPWHLILVTGLVVRDPVRTSSLISFSVEESFCRWAPSSAGGIHLSITYRSWQYRGEERSLAVSAIWRPWQGAFHRLQSQGQL